MVAVTVTVVIPWRPGCPHREAALGWVLARWRAAGYEPVLGQPPAGPWRKAAAVSGGLRRAAGGVLVVADADVWTDGVDEAIDAVAGGMPWAIPHGPVHRLTRTAADTVLAGGPPGGELEQPPYRGFEGGGIVVLRREVYEQAPLDRRFAGWGQEDECWALALRTLAGRPWRGTAPLWHLWHPPQQRDSRRWGSTNSRALYHRYRRAAGRPDQMRALLDEMEVP
ncbi:hypothetical protein RM844_30385 [Streptomyces sp. DSM 44915]|uniref:Glycosyltransferase n=1 Tax=Streptomyces chisholmiae TaxID=3075540 RepID=A0ABU2K075_9ACTN|nr:hypothetical protein [Streptomyces sp. DSM 44915]MDT0270590.1 hypothetical protein [Streptomyces sp. DSM 44915]